MIRIIKTASKTNNNAILEKALNLFPSILNKCDLVEIIFRSDPIRDPAFAELIISRYPNKLQLSQLLKKAITSSADTSIADIVLRIEPDVVVADTDNLRHAAYYGHLPTVQLFIAKGTSLNNNNKLANWEETPQMAGFRAENVEWEETPLMVAFRTGNVEVVAALITAGAFLGRNPIKHVYTHHYTHTSDSTGYSATFCDTVHSTVVGSIPFCMALNTANDTILNVFYARKDELIDGVKLIDYAGEYITPLMHSVLRSVPLSMMERLIREGADLDKTVKGKDALSYAVESGNADKVCSFLSFIVTHRSYADIKGMLIGGRDEMKPARNLIKTNPIYLDKAIERGDPDIVELFLLHGASATPAHLQKLSLVGTSLLYKN